MTTGTMAGATTRGQADTGGTPWKRIVAFFVVGIVVALYFTGRLDYALYNVGLNFHTCARNGFGATFCGGDLTAYENRVRGVQQNFQQTEQTITRQECQADPQLNFCTGGTP